MVAQEHREIIFAPDSKVEEDRHRHMFSSELLRQKAHEVCLIEGLDYNHLEALQKKFLTHFRCPTCKMLPLYYLDIRQHTRVRCKKCGNVVSFTSGGKYGKLRKKIASFLIPHLESVFCEVQTAAYRLEEP